MDPATGIHTQAIESYWAKAKQKFKEMKDVSSHLLPNYLDERMWRDRWVPQVTMHLQTFSYILQNNTFLQISLCKSDIYYGHDRLYNSSASTLYCECDVIIHNHVVHQRLLKI